MYLNRYANKRRLTKNGLISDMCGSESLSPLMKYDIGRISDLVMEIQSDTFLEPFFAATTQGRFVLFDFVRWRIIDLCPKNNMAFRSICHEWPPAITDQFICNIMVSSVFMDGGGGRRRQHGVLL